VYQYDEDTRGFKGQEMAGKPGSAEDFYLKCTDILNVARFGYFFLVPLSFIWHSVKTRAE
jgi:hypothetical protein